MATIAAGNSHFPYSDHFPANRRTDTIDSHPRHASFTQADILKPTPTTAFQSLVGHPTARLCRSPQPPCSLSPRPLIPIDNAPCLVAVGYFQRWALPSLFGARLACSRMLAHNSIRPDHLTVVTSYSIRVHLVAQACVRV